MAIFSRPAQPGRAGESTPRRTEGTGLTIIAQGTTIVGDIGSDAVVKVEGTIQGSVRAGSQLLVAHGAVIRGDLFAAEIVVGGEVHGSLHAEERVEIQAGALVNGDIRTQRIHAADGSRVNGQISMEPTGESASLNVGKAATGTASNV
jgi:cytoskeletal protein CcmA (bactofilin family)